MTLQGGHDFDYGYCGSGSSPPSVVEVSINWLYQSGGMDVQTYTGIDSDCEPYNNGFDVNDPIGKTGFYPSCEDADATGSFNLPAETDHFDEIGAWNNQTETKLMIVPSGQQTTGGTTLYLALVSALQIPIPVNDPSGLGTVGSIPVAPGSLTLNGQPLVSSGITNGDGSVSGMALISAPSGAPVPLAVSAPVSAYSFNGQVYQLVSQCVATLPSNQARTNVGVGEQVSLYFNPALPLTNITWSTTAGALNITNISSSSSNLFTAPNFATNVTVTATIWGMLFKSYYKIVEPSGVFYVTNGLKHAYDEADIGFRVEVYLQPDSVNFGAVWSQEEQAYVVANGVYSQWNGYPHEPNPIPIQCTTLVVPGRGTLSGLDFCYSGPTDPSLSIPYTNGTENISIPWDFRVGTTNAWKTNFTTLVWNCSKGSGGDEGEGVLNASKANTSCSFNVDDPSVSDF